MAPTAYSAPTIQHQGMVAAGYQLDEESRARRALWILSALYAAAVAVCVLLLLASIYTWRGMAEMRETAARIDQIADFERRINERLNGFNAGVQAMIDETNSRISTIRSEIESAAVSSREATAQLKALTDQLQLRLDSMRWESARADDGDGTDAAPPPREVRRSVPFRQPEAEAKNAPAAAKPQVTASPAFRRSIAPDGSVRYEKVR